MVVHARGCNFSTADSSLSSSGDGPGAPPRDPPASLCAGGLSRSGHAAVTVCLGFILVAGILNNSLASGHPSASPRYFQGYFFLTGQKSNTKSFRSSLSTGFDSMRDTAVAKINLSAAQRREKRVLAMVLSMVSCYMLCWMPYGVMALTATLGRSGLVTPVASVVPSVLAKLSTVTNPVIYVFFNNQFYRCLVAFLKCSPEPCSRLQKRCPPQPAQ